MTIKSFELSRALHLINGTSNEAIISADHPEWLEISKVYPELAESIMEVGSYEVRAFYYDTAKKISYLSPDELISKLSSFGLDAYDSERFTKHITSLKYEQAIVHFKSDITFTIVSKEKITDLKDKSFLALDCTHKESPYLTIAPYHPLRNIVDILYDPAKALGYYKQSYPYGYCKNLTLEKVKRVASLFSQSMPAIEAFLQSPNILTVVTPSQDHQFIISKKPCGVKLYTFFNQHVFAGAYKKIAFGVSLHTQVDPVAITFCSDTDDYLQEIRIRRNKFLSPLLTPTHLYWCASPHGNLISKWACYGPLGELFHKKLSLENLDTLALQLLEKMHLFHMHAIHKDLKPENILVDRQGDQFILYINDVGTCALKEQEARLKMMTTNSYLLAPELIKLCRAKLGRYSWSSLHTFADLNYDIWMKSERFTIGEMLFELYTQCHPYKESMDLTELKLLFPYSELKFDEIFCDLKAREELEDFLTADQKFDLRSQYEKAYNKMMIDKGKFHKVNSTTEFMEKYRDLTARVEIEIAARGTDSFQQILEIYKKGYHQMRRAHSQYFYELYSRYIATIDKNPKVLNPLAVKPEIESRIDAILPLFSLNPDQRPSLEIVAEAIRGIILSEKKAPEETAGTSIAIYP